MSYYPILQAPYCTGQTTLYNFAPNNWEPVSKNKQYINLTYINDNAWHSMVLGELNKDGYKIITHHDIAKLIPKNTLPLLSITHQTLPETSQTLPPLNTNRTLTPAYRATLALDSGLTKTSYQGELDPFPPKASLLTFSPFLQFGKDIENYVLLLNIEKKASNREVEVKIYDANTKILKSTQTASSNNISVISLDDFGFNKQSLPIVTCNDMAAIPLYFSCANKGEFLSLEHTHPPASLVVHGNRFGVQKHLKQFWFRELQDSE